jgi:steroid delta-isomerase-like uncharacterized protein
MRSAELLPFMVRAVYKQPQFQKIPHLWDYFRASPEVPSRQRDSGELKGGLEMSAEENKALVERFVEEFWNEGNMSAADELMAPNAKIHLPSGEVVNPDEAKGFAARWRESFPDWHSTFEELVAEGDRVAERWTGRGTHQGELQGIPPTGKRVEAPGSVFYRIVDGKIVELWGQLDMMSLMQQLGAVPSPQQAEA